MHTFSFAFYNFRWRTTRPTRRGAVIVVLGTIQLVLHDNNNIIIVYKLPPHELVPARLEFRRYVRGDQTGWLGWGVSLSSSPLWLFFQNLFNNIIIDAIYSFSKMFFSFVLLSNFFARILMPNCFPFTTEQLLLNIPQLCTNCIPHHGWTTVWHYIYCVEIEFSVFSLFYFNRNHQNSLQNGLHKNRWCTFVINKRCRCPSFVSIDSLLGWENKITQSMKW